MFTNLAIKEGDELWVSGEYKLSTSSVYVSLHRFDNYKQYESNGTLLGSEEWSNDGALHATAGSYSGFWRDAAVATGYRPAANELFRITLHARVSSVSGQALTELYANGAKIGSSTAANNYQSRSFDKLRVGVVAIGDVNRSVTVYFRNIRLAGTPPAQL
jgi:hypothetical protein